MFSYVLRKYFERLQSDSMTLREIRDHFTSLTDITLYTSLQEKLKDDETLRRILKAHENPNSRGLLWTPVFTAYGEEAIELGRDYSIPKGIHEVQDGDRILSVDMRTPKKPKPVMFTIEGQGETFKIDTSVFGKPTNGLSVFSNKTDIAGRSALEVATRLLYKQDQLK
jgi:hypothetical protein